MEAISSPTAYAQQITVADVVRARVSDAPVALPVRAPLYASFDHVRAIPSSSQGGYSIARLRIVDAMLARVQGQEPQIDTETALERLAEQISVRIEARRESEQFARGFVLDIVA